MELFLFTFNHFIFTFKYQLFTNFLKFSSTFFTRFRINNENSLTFFFTFFILTRKIAKGYPLPNLTLRKCMIFFDPTFCKNFHFFTLRFFETEFSLSTFYFQIFYSPIFSFFDIFGKFLKVRNSTQNFLKLKNPKISSIFFQKSMHFSKKNFFFSKLSLFQIQKFYPEILSRNLSFKNKTLFFHFFLIFL